VLWLALTLASIAWLCRARASVAGLAALAFSLGGVLHMALDSVVGDIWWLAPFVDRPYALFTVPARMHLRRSYSEGSLPCRYASISAWYF